MSNSISSRALEHQVLIIGGGTAGITVAARLTRGWSRGLDVAVVEPSSKHYYQSLWTLVGAGLVPKERTQRAEKQVMPRRATWIHDAVAEFLPERNLVKTRDGRAICYDWLVVAAGLQLNWSQIPGLEESVGQRGVCSTYSYATVDSTWETIRNFHGGNAVFTHPSGAVKCGGAPQKMMYLADDCFRKAGIRDQTNIIFASAEPNIFAIDSYRKTLEQVIARKQIDCRFRHDLIEIRTDVKEAIFQQLDTGEKVTIPFEMLHVTPPMGSPDFIARSALADRDGWVDVDKATLRHRRFENVFALGDCSNLPTAKSAAAVRKQAPVLVRNLRAAIRGSSLTAGYDGYTSCPLLTGFGKLVLAEFDYNQVPRETFPVDQSRERWSMWLLKRYFLPFYYWHAMLKGRA